MDTRTQFIEDLVGTLLAQRDILDIGQWPPQIQDVYDAGVRTAVAGMLSITDSRPLNGARHRIVDAAGKVIEFYPDGTAPTDITQMGLIVAVSEAYQLAVGLKVSA